MQYPRTYRVPPPQKKSQNRNIIVDLTTWDQCKSVIRRKETTFGVVWFDVPLDTFWVPHLQYVAQNVPTSQCYNARKMTQPLTGGPDLNVQFPISNFAL